MHPFFSLCAHLRFFCVHGISFQYEQLLLFDRFCCVLFLCRLSVLFLTMSTQAASAQDPTQEIRDQAHHGGWRWDAMRHRWMSRAELVSTPLTLVWTGAVPSTLEATVINEGKKESGFAKLRRWEIMTWDLELSVRKGLRAFAGKGYAAARRAERNEVAAFEKEEQNVLTKFGSGRKGTAQAERAAPGKAAEKKREAEKLLQATKSARALAIWTGTIAQPSARASPHLFPNYPRRSVRGVVGGLPPSCLRRFPPRGPWGAMPLWWP